MVANDRKCSQTISNGRKRSQAVTDSRKQAQMVSNGRKRSKRWQMLTNGRILSQMVAIYNFFLATKPIRPNLMLLQLQAPLVIFISPP